MKEHFSDLLKTNGVEGVVFFSKKGDIIFEEFNDSATPEATRFDNWQAVASTIVNVREGDLIFERGRLYIRKTEKGFLLVVMSLATSIAMVKLNCDILLPHLNKSSESKGFKRFFKR
jgi:hypothetical protein